MHLTFIFVLILCQICGFTYAQEPFFRKDYTYVHHKTSFYKLHIIRETWQDAMHKCELEGSSLFYPEDETEAAVMTDIMKNRTQFPVFVAGSAWLADGVYETMNGVPVSNLYNNWAIDKPSGNHYRNCIIFHRNGTLADVDCNTKYPFICKKTVDSLKWDHNCNMPDQGYEYFESLGRCYKYHNKSLDWPAAYAVCRAELSYLAVIGSQDEANLLVNITAQYKNADAPRSSYRNNDPIKVLLGFHDRYALGWMTIKGVLLNESGYSTWANGEPNEVLRDGKRIERCGSMLSDGQLTDVFCRTKLTFICEHEIDPEKKQVM